VAPALRLHSGKGLHACSFAMQSSYTVDFILKLHAVHESVCTHVEHCALGSSSCTVTLTL
jgi:hypothetical protein